MAGLAKLTPNYYYLGGDPLINGMNWAGAGLLAGLTIALVAAAIVLFDRRDLRTRG